MGVLKVKEGGVWRDVGVTAARTPIGAVTMWFTGTPPQNWLLLDGQTVSRTLYAVLYALWGTAFNTGGEAGTDFRLPNVKGRVPVGFDAGQTEFNAIGKLAGAKTVTLATTEIPAHAHGINGDGGHAHDVGWPGAAAGGANALSIVEFGTRQTTGSNTMASVANHAHGGGTVNAGGGGAHNNLQPSIAVNFIVCAL